MNFYHEILTPCVLVMKASYQIESMVFFLPLKRKYSDFVFILMTLFDHAKEIKSHATIIYWLVLLFIFYLGKTMKTTVGFTINGNNIYTYGKQIYFRNFNTLLFEKRSNA